MADRNNLEKLLFVAYEAGRDQGMEDIGDIVSGKLSPLLSTEERFAVFLKNHARQINALLSK